MTRTFHHRFKGGIIATLTFEINDLHSGEVTPKRCEWSRQPSKRIIPEYHRWQHTVYESLANDAQAEVTHFIQVGPAQWECWVYEPGKPGVRWEAVK